MQCELATQNKSDVCTRTTRQTRRPLTRALRDKLGVTLHVDLPGLKQEQVKLEVDNQVLNLSAQTEFPSASEDKTWLFREFGPTQYERSFRLGEKIDVHKIAASMNDGVLRIVLPYKAETLPKKIDVSID